MKKANPDDKGLADKNPEEPELEFWEVPYVEAFYTLTSSRNSGMGVGAIPLSEILLYCEFFSEADPEAFIKIIQTADNAFLSAHEKHSEQKAKEQNASQPT